MAMQQQEYQSKYNPTENINAAFGMEGLGLDVSGGTSERVISHPHPILSSVGDLPASYLMEHLHHWTTCSPQERYPNDNLVQELGNNRFAVLFPGEPCKYIFSRTKPTAASYTDFLRGGNAQPTSSSRKTASDTASGALKISSSTRARRKSINKGTESTKSKMDSSNKANDNYGSSKSKDNKDESSRSTKDGGGTVYLLEVQYYLRILNGQSLFAAMPPNVYGLLAPKFGGLRHARYIKNC